jgi:putative flippase GtrA
MWELILASALKFGVVGLFGYLIDVSVFNALRVGVLGDAFVDQPLLAKAISVTLSTVATWFGNRYWTFREYRRRNVLLEFVEFGAIAVVGLGIGLLCLWVSHYVLGFTSLLADNISANVIGLVLATTFRFLMYRFWVYGRGRSDSLAVLRANAADAEVKG